MATLTQTAGALYDSGTTDPNQLATELVRKTGVSLLQALSAARGVIASKAKTVGDTLASPITAPLDSLGDVAGVIKDTAEEPVRIIKWLTDPNSWLRVSYVIIGGAFILIGVRKLTGDQVSPAVQKVTAVIGQVRGVGSKAGGAISAVTSKKSAGAPNGE